MHPSLLSQRLSQPKYLNQLGLWFILVIIVCAFAAKFGLIVLGVQHLGLDATTWQSVGHAILEGQVPYVDAPDNKPPFWLFIAAASEATGYYTLLMLTVTASSTIFVVYAVCSLTTKESDSATGLLGAIIAAELITSSSLHVNNKATAIALALAAVIVMRPSVSGVFAGLATGIAQQAGVIVPIIAAYRWRVGKWGVFEAAYFTGVSLIVFSLQYALVGAVWGVDAALVAIEQSIGSIIPYLSGGGAFPNQTVMANDPGRVVYIRLMYFLSHQIAFIGALLGGVLVASQRVQGGLFWVIWTVMFGPMLLLTGYSHYVVLITPGIAVLSALGVRELFVIFDELPAELSR